MTVSGLIGSLSRCPLLPPGILGSRHARVKAFSAAGKPKQGTEFLQAERTSFSSPSLKCNGRQVQLVRSAMDASYGDMSNDSAAVFPRISVKDPYKRLGISKEASEEEIQAARNFLIQKYAGHKPSVDSIESAHDKIIMQKFYERRNPKIDFKKKMREVNQSRFVQAVRERFRTPSTKFIIKTSLAFLLLGVLTVLFPTEEGPTLQVAISLIATIYFVHDRLKSKLRAFLYGAGAFVFSWLLGTFLMVSVIPPIPIIKGPRAFESLSKKTRLIFLTSPPVNEAQIYGNSGVLRRPRNNESCRIYSEACLELCREMNIKAIDLWSAIQKRADWRDVCFTDGIHLSSEGSKIVVKEIMKVLKEADWEPSLHWMSMPNEFGEDSPYDPLDPDGKTLNVSSLTFLETAEWE